MKKFMMIMVIVSLSFIVVGCSKDANEADSTFEREAVMVTHSILTGATLSEEGTSYDTTGMSYQEVTEEFLTNPTRVAIFSYDALDILDAVGIENTSISMLGVVKSNLPSFLDAFDDEAYENVGSLFMPDFDALDLFQPELIIIGSRSTGAYDALKEQYPNANILDVTLTYGEYQEGLTRNAQNLAKIFPTVESEITSKLNDLTNTLNDIQSVTESHKALFILVNGQSLSFFGPTGRFAVLHDEFGFLAADENVDSGGSHGDLVGYEYIQAVNPEVLFLMDRAAAIGNESTLDDVTSNQLVQNTTAGTNDHIYALDGEAWYLASGGFQATEIMIADIQAYIDDLGE